MNTIILETDDVKLKFVQRADDSFKWDMYIWHCDHWGDIAIEQTGNDVLWQMAWSVMEEPQKNS